MQRSGGERTGRPELTTRTIEATEEQAWEFTAVAGYLGQAQGVYRAPHGPAYVHLTFGSPTLSKPAHARQAATPTTRAAQPPAPAGPRLVATESFPNARAMAPDGIPARDHELLRGPAPSFSAEQAIAVVQSYIRQMAPLYRIGVDEKLPEAEQRRRYAAQDALRRAFWRRTDRFHEGGVMGGGTEYDLCAMTAWHAAPVDDRLWQVTYARRYLFDKTLNEGYLVMLFDDAPKLVDAVEGAS